MSQEALEQTVRVEAENIGGIKRSEVMFEPGVTILTGRNATNRTSFLQAIMAGLGSDQLSLKGDADRGHVTLEIGDETYTRDVIRQGGTVVSDGDPYLDDSTLADLFAFLLESNDARRAVVFDQDLRDIIMEPIDADALQAEIRQLQSERERIEDTIAERERLKENLPQLEEQRYELEEQIEAKREALAEKREELAEESKDAAEAREEKSDLEAKMEELQNARSRLDNTEFRLESEQESLDSLEDQREELAAEFDELADEETPNVDDISAEIDQLREQKQRLDTELSKLQNVIQFNEEMLGGASEDIASALRGDDTNESVTDQLLDDGDNIVCWTCGSEVDRESIEGTLDRLRDLRQEKYATQDDIESELDDLKDKRSSIQATKQQREDVKGRLADVRAEIEQREESIADLEAQREDIEEEIDQFEDEVTELEEEDRSEVLDLQREVNELELELDRLEDEREEIDGRIDEIQDQIDDIESLENQKESLNEQLTELRTRVDRIEEDAVSGFNEHMETVLDILEYDNLDRIWVERVEREGREGRRKVTKAEFRLHIVRSTEDGVAYEDEFEHLSESEREVTGLVFALAGYLAHNVYEDVPFILLDSLEAIDSERIAKLVEYFQEYAENLVVALLQEDAAALDDAYERVSTI